MYFLITEIYDPEGHFYAIEDCNTNGYSSCTVLNSAQPAYSAPWGIVAAESAYGGTACTTQIMGSSSNVQNFGTSANPVQWQKGLNASWTTESLNTAHATCSHYSGAFSNTILSTHDTRNTS